MKNKIKQFLEVTQFYEMAKESISSLVAADGVAVDMENVFNMEEIEEAIIPLYEAKFTESEIDSILYFFNSPVGKKMLDVNSALSESINGVFNEWISQKYSQYLSETL